MLRCSFLPHFLESVLLGLEVPPILVGGLGHVGQQVAKLDELPPGLLVVLATGVGQLRRLDPKVDNVWILDAAHGDGGWYIRGLTCPKTSVNAKS